MATRVYGSQESLAESSANTTATPADAVSLTLPSADISSKTVAVLFSAGYSQRTNNSTQANARLYQNTSATELFRSSREPFTQTSDVEWPTISGAWPLTFGASPGDQVVKLQYFNESGTADVRMRDACLTYVVLGSDDLAASTTAATPTATSTTWQNYLTWTAPATGDFDFFVCGCVRSSATTSSAGWRVLMNDGSTTRFTSTNLPDDVDDFISHGCYFRRSVTSGQTIIVQHNRGTGSGTITPQRAAIIGFRVNSTNFDATYNVEDHTARSTTSTSNVTRNAASELTATPAAVAHLFFGAANINRTTNITRSAVRFMLPTSTEQTEVLLRGANYGSQNVLSFRQYTPAASSTTWRPEMRSVEAGTTNSDAATMGGWQLVPAATTLTPANASVTIATFAPIVQVGTVLTPSTLALTTATFAPTIKIGAVVTPANAALTVATFAPTVANPTVATPSTLALTVTTFAPTVRVGTVLTPSSASLAVTTFAPSIVLGTRLTPSTLALTTATFAPTVATPTAVTPAPASVAVTTFAPTVANPTAVTPAKLSLTITTFAPTVNVGSASNLTPAPAALTIALFAPTVAVSDHKTVTPTTLALAVTTFAPAVSVGYKVTPSTLALSVALFAPVVTADQKVTPAAASVIVTTHAPTVVVGAVVTPAPAAVTVALLAPAVTLGTNVTPSTLALTITMLAPFVVTIARPVIIGGTATRGYGARATSGYRRQLATSYSSERRAAYTSTTTGGYEHG